MYTQTTLQQLPPLNFDMLSHILAHLNRLSAYSDITKMTATKLGTVIGPSLVRAKQAEAVTPQWALLLAEALIMHYDDLFTPDVPDDTSVSHVTHAHAKAVFVVRKAA
jgi:hypothetical protein